MVQWKEAEPGRLYAKAGGIYDLVVKTNDGSEGVYYSVKTGRRIVADGRVPGIDTAKDVAYEIAHACWLETGEWRRWADRILREAELAPDDGIADEGEMRITLGVLLRRALGLG